MRFLVLLYCFYLSDPVFAEDEMRVGTWVRIQPHSDLHSLACGAILNNATMHEFLDPELRLGELDQPTYLGVYAVEEVFHKSARIRPAPERSEIAAEDLIFSRVAQTSLSAEPLFGWDSARSTLQQGNAFGLLPELLRFKSEIRFKEWVASYELKSATPRFQYNGLESFLVHVLTPEYIFPIRYSRLGNDGRQISVRRTLLTTNVQWEQIVLDPIIRDDPILLTKEPKRAGRETGLELVVPVPEADIQGLPEDLRKALNSGNIINESLEQPHNVAAFTAYYNGDAERSVDKPRIYRILSEENILETRGYLVVYTLKDTFPAVIPGAAYRGLLTSPIEKTTQQKFPYRILFDAEGRRLSSTLEAYDLKVSEFRALEDLLSLWASKMTYPFFGTNPEVEELPSLTLANELSAAVSSRTSLYVTEKDPVRILGLLKSRSLSWTGYERTGIGVLESLLKGKKIKRSVARYVVRKGAGEQEALEDHFLFATKDFFIYFRLPVP